MSQRTFPNHTGKRKDRKITNYYEKIRQGKQEKLFHEVIFQIGNREDMAVGTEAGNLAVNVLDEYVKDFQKRNPTLRVFSSICIRMRLLHISILILSTDSVPYHAYFHLEIQDFLMPVSTKLWYTFLFISNQSHKE